MPLNLAATITLPVSHLESSILFYTESTGFFKDGFDFGMREFLVVKKESDFGIILKESFGWMGSDRPTFSLYVTDVLSEFDRLKSKTFECGGGLCTPSRGAIFQYPLEANFLMKDPSGNRFLVSGGFKP